jgi:hypothetical protein
MGVASECLCSTRSCNDAGEWPLCSGHFGAPDVSSGPNCDCLAPRERLFPRLLANSLGMPTIRLSLLRIVRRLPTCAQLSSLDESDGQVLDNPQGRKPRGLAMPISRYAVLWRFERRQKWMRLSVLRLQEHCVSLARQGRRDTKCRRDDGGGSDGAFCSTRPRAFATA